MRVRICSMICSTWIESERMLKSAINGCQLSSIPLETERSVDNQHDAHRPQGDAREKGPIREQQIGGTSTFLTLVHQIEVPEYSIQRKRDRQPEPLSAELLLRFRADRVEHVRDQRGRG